MMLSLILLYMHMILLKVALSVIRPLIWGTTRDMKWLVDFMLEKFKLFHLTRRTSQVLLMWKWLDLILMKNYHMLSGLPFSIKLCWGSYIVSIVKTFSKKIGAFIAPWSVLFVRLLAGSVNLLYDLVWKFLFMTGLVLLAANWIFVVSYRNRSVGLLIIHLKPCLIV